MVTVVAVIKEAAITPTVAERAVMVVVGIIRQKDVVIPTIVWAIPLITVIIPLMPVVCLEGNILTAMRTTLDVVIVLTGRAVEMSETRGVTEIGTLGRLLKRRISTVVVIIVVLTG